MTQKNRKQLRYAVSTHTIERLRPSKEAMRLCEQVSSGTLTADAAVAAVLKRHGLKQVIAHG